MKPFYYQITIFNKDGNNITKPYTLLSDLIELEKLPKKVATEMNRKGIFDSGDVQVIRMRFENIESNYQKVSKIVLNELTHLSPLFLHLVDTVVFKKEKEQLYLKVQETMSKIYLRKKGKRELIFKSKSNADAITFIKSYFA